MTVWKSDRTTAGDELQILSMFRNFYESRTEKRNPIPVISITI